MKTSKVKRVTGNGTWEGNYGMMYKFEVEFENGDCGEYSSKMEFQTKFIEGEEANYEFIDGKFPKVKPYYAPLQSNGQISYKKDDNVQQSIIKQSCLKAAVDFCRGNDCSPEEVCSTAQIFVDWVNGKETNNEPKKQGNDLPF
jgi:hypothetical protein